MELKDIIAQQQAMQQQSALLRQEAGKDLSAETAKGAAKGAASGAALGSAVGPWGTVIGGAVGGIAGGLSSNLKGQKAKKEAEESLRQVNAQANILDNQKLNMQSTAPTEFKMGGELTRFKGEDHAKGGIRIGKDEVEGEETMLDDYIFSNYLSPKGSNKTFAELTKSIDDKYYRKNDPFSDRAKNSQYEDLRKQQDEINEKYSKAEEVPKEFRCGGSRKVGKDVMDRKYVMGGSLGEKYELGGLSNLSSGDPQFNYFDQQTIHPEIGPVWENTVEPSPLLASDALNIQTIPNEAPSQSAMFNFESEALGNQAFVPEFDVQGNLIDDSPNKFWGKAGDVAGSVGDFGKKAGPALLQALPGLISAASNFKTADKINYGSVQAQTVDPNLLDPRRALQEVGTAFSGANEQLGGLQGGQYLSNRIASAASEANARGGVAQKYDEANAQILNRTDLSNASARSQANLVNLQQATQQTQDRLQATGQGYEQLSNAASAAIGAYNTNQRDAKMLPYLGTENFPVYMDKAGNPTLDFESSRDGVDYNQNVIGKKARAAKSKKKN